MNTYHIQYTNSTGVKEVEFETEAAMVEYYNMLENVTDVTMFINDSEVTV